MPKALRRIRSLPENMTNRIVCGDAVQEMQRIPDLSIGLTVTSPPYDALRLYAGDPAHSKIPLEAMVGELYRITVKGGVVVWVVADQTIKGSESGSSFRQALTFIEWGWLLHDTMIYRRFEANPPAHNRYIQEFEYMFVFSKGKPRVANIIKDRKNKYTTEWGRNTKRTRDGKLEERANSTRQEYGRRTNIWEIHAGSQDSKGINHPSKFPDSLARDHILTWSNQGDVVLDPMCGCGTTCVEAFENARKFIGIDIVPEYCELARERVANCVPF